MASSALCLKHHYRSRVIDDSDDDVTAQSISKAISLFDSLHMLRVAWGQVTSACIGNCWRKAGFSQRTLVDEEPLTCPEGFDSKNFSAYVTCDDSLECHGSLSTSDIMDIICSKDAVADDIEEDPLPPVLPKDASAAISTLKAFVAQRAEKEKASELFDMIYALEAAVDRLLSKSVRQTAITNFFNQ